MKKELVILLTLNLMLSCYTLNIDSLDETSSSEIYLKMAQDATLNNDYTSAIKIYEKMIKVYRNRQDVYMIGLYEIAFINYKRGDLELAKKQFKDIIKKPYNYPTWVKYLSQKILDKLEDEG